MHARLRECSTNVDAALDLYFAQCSVLVTTRDLAAIAATLANGGVNPLTGVRALALEHVERVLTVMATCGMYDFAGEWLYTVGLPAKSGVAGGVIAVLPGQLGIGVFSPRLDPRGNSVRGVRACQELAARHHLHQYRPGLVSTDAVARTYGADVMCSRRSRSAEESRALAQHGARIRVYELRGDLVFGSAERLVRRVLDDVGEIGWAVLDFRRVTGVNGTAWELLAGLAARARDHGVRLIASHRERPPVALETAPTTDEALQRSEDDLLRGELGDRHAAVPLAEQPLLADLAPGALAAIEDVAVAVHLEPGEVVFREGDEADAIFFVVAGSVSAQLTVPGAARPRRLQGMGPGVAFGELSVVDAGPRSADVVATEHSTVHRLSFDDLRDLEARHPGVTAALLRNVPGCSRSGCAWPPSRCGCSTDAGGAQPSRRKLWISSTWMSGGSVAPIAWVAPPGGRARILRQVAVAPHVHHADAARDGGDPVEQDPRLPSAAPARPSAARTRSYSSRVAPANSRITATATSHPLHTGEEALQVQGFLRSEWRIADSNR